MDHHIGEEDVGDEAAARTSARQGGLRMRKMEPATGVYVGKRSMQAGAAKRSNHARETREVSCLHTCKLSIISSPHQFHLSIRKNG